MTFKIKYKHYPFCTKATSLSRTSAMFRILSYVFVVITVITLISTFSGGNGASPAVYAVVAIVAAVTVAMIASAVFFSKKADKVAKETAAKRPQQSAVPLPKEWLNK